MSKSADIRGLREDVDQLIRLIGGRTVVTLLSSKTFFPDTDKIKYNDGLIGELRTQFHELLDYLGLELIDRIETPWKIVKKEKDNG